MTPHPQDYTLKMEDNWRSDSRIIAVSLDLHWHLSCPHYPLHISLTALAEAFLIGLPISITQISFLMGLSH